MAASCSDSAGLGAVSDEESLALFGEQSLVLGRVCVASLCDSEASGRQGFA